MFFAVIPVLVIAGTGGTFGVFQRTAVFLTGPAVIGKFPVLVHSKTRFTNRVTAWQLLWVFSIAFVKRDCSSVKKKAKLNRPNRINRQERAKKKPNYCTNFQSRQAKGNRSDCEYGSC